MNSCDLCCIESDGVELIQLKDSLIKMYSRAIRFTDVMGDVFQAKIDHLKCICNACKEQIVSFYKFKDKVRISFEGSQASQEIITVVKEFVELSAEKLIIVKSENILSIMTEGHNDAHILEVPPMSVDDEAASHEEIFGNEEDFNFEEIVEDESPAVVEPPHNGKVATFSWTTRKKVKPNVIPSNSGHKVLSSSTKFHSNK